MRVSAWRLSRDCQPLTFFAALRARTRADRALRLLSVALSAATSQTSCKTTQAQLSHKPQYCYMQRKGNAVMVLSVKSRRYEAVDRG